MEGGIQIPFKTSKCGAGYLTKADSRVSTHLARQHKKNARKSKFKKKIS